MLFTSPAVQLYSPARTPHGDAAAADTLGVAHGEDSEDLRSQAEFTCQHHTVVLCFKISLNAIHTGSQKVLELSGFLKSCFLITIK